MARLKSKECILYTCDSKTTAAIIKKCTRKTIYIPLIVDIKCNWGLDNEQVIEMMLSDDGEKAKNEKLVTQSKASRGKAEATTAKERPSETLYTAAAHTTTVPAKEGLTDQFYIDSGESNHHVPSKGDLRAYT